MTLAELHTWLLSIEGLGPELSRLRRWAAVQALSSEALTAAPDLVGYDPDWPRLLLAASTLATADSYTPLEAALMTAQAALQWGPADQVRDSGALILSQLSNHRALGLGRARGALAPDLDGRLGVTELLNQTRRELEQTVFLHPSLAASEASEGMVRSLTASRFQREFWEGLKDAQWVSASAPTAAGKTFLVLQWLLDRFLAKQVDFAIFVAPTRALVAEIERELQETAVQAGFHALRVGSLPLAVLGDRARPTILVFTQERLQLFLNAAGDLAASDVVVVDEVHKLGDGARGVILQDAIERLARANPAAQFVFLSPLTENPELLVEDAPDRAPRAVVPNETPTVVQNVVLAEQAPITAKRWKLQLRQEGELTALGDLELHAKPDGVRKRLSYMALALGRAGSGTLIYANDADEAEKIASQIYDGLEPDFAKGAPIPQALTDLSDFAAQTVHDKFALVEFARRGVAFHYGNMPSLLRFEIERLFREGQIRFLVCTSTLIEGVNLACQTIVVRGPRKGPKTKMRPHDFWNLAGRAGRWGQDFQGNIVCVDPDDKVAWPDGVPSRAKYRIARATETVLEKNADLLAFLVARPEMREAIDPDLEQVAAYLLCWRLRVGPIAEAPVGRRLSPEYLAELEASLDSALSRIDVPKAVILRHVGVSAFGLQGLLDYFRRRGGDVERYLPPSPESRDAQSGLVAIFTRIHNNMYPAFTPLTHLAAPALTTVNWMRGFPLARMIRERIAWLERNKGQARVPKEIRETMKEVEEFARFKAPKYLAAYLDVLRCYLQEVGRSDLMTERPDIELYLEFGVGTQTLISMIGLGLSRTSAVELTDWLGDSELDERAVLERLRSRDWDGLNIPNVVKREITEIVARHAARAA